MPRIVKIPVTLEQLMKPPTYAVPIAKAPKQEVYISLPKYFESTTQWPAMSNLHCWECSQIPPAYPKFIPTSKFQTHNGQNIYSVRGVFHDWCCAATHVLREYPREAAVYLERMCEIDALYTGRRRVNMVESVSKYRMQQFIGDAEGVTVEQWNGLNDAKTAEETIYA